MIISQDIHQGLRDSQEDALKLINIDENHQLCLVCDGLGGHPQGEVASSLAIEICEQLSEKLYSEQKPKTQYEWLSWMQSLSADLNSWFQGEEGWPTCMLHPQAATTISGALVGPDFIVTLFAGDSHLSIHKKSGHVVYQAEKQELQNGHLYSCLIASFFANCNYKPSIKILPFLPGQTLLLASDGIETLNEAEINTIIAKESPSELADYIVGNIMFRPSEYQDNVTVMTIHNSL